MEVKIDRNFRQEDDVLFEVNTAKVSAEIPSPVAGKVEEILYKEGDTVAVGIVVAIIDLDGEESSGTEPASEGATNEGADASQVAADVSGTSQSAADIAKSQSVNTASTLTCIFHRLWSDNNYFKTSRCLLNWNNLSS